MNSSTPDAVAAACPEEDVEVIIAAKLLAYLNIADEKDEFWDDEETEDELNNRCLITHDALLPDFVTLECGHKFNYDPLLQDLHKHKSAFNPMEFRPLRKNEIRCPFCRNVQETLLPWYESKPKYAGINAHNPSDVKIPFCHASPTCKAKYGVVRKEDNQPYCHAHAYELNQKAQSEAKRKAKEQKIAQQKIKQALQIVKMEQKEVVAALAKKVKEETDALVEQGNAVYVMKSGKLKLGCMHTFTKGPRTGTMCLATVPGTPVAGQMMCSRHKVGVGVGGGGSGVDGSGVDGSDSLGGVAGTAPGEFEVPAEPEV